MKAVFCKIVITQLKRDNISSLGLRGKEMNLNADNDESIDIIMNIYMYNIKTKAPRILSHITILRSQIPSIMYARDH